MKTQIIQLETHDDLVSVRDKMGWGQASRIVLVWPSQPDFLSRRVDLLLLQRHSRVLGAQLALVTSGQEVKAHAHELGIPVFKTLRKAQSQNWRVRRRSMKRIERQSPPPDPQAIRDHLHSLRNAWYKSPAARGSYYALTLLVLLVLSGSLLPRATITLVPVQQEQQMALTLSAGPSFSSPSRTGELPVRVRQVVVERRAAAAATGKIMIPSRAAEGSVRFTNLTEKRLSIPEGTVVSTLSSDPAKAVRYRTLRSAAAAAGAGQTISVPVIALNPGTAGNLRANQVVVIEGPLGLSAAVNNPNPLRGGTSLPAQTPSEADYKYLYSLAMTALQEDALEEALLGMPAGSFAIAETLVLDEVIEEVYTPPAPQEGEEAWPSPELELTLIAEFSVWVVTGEDVIQAAALALDANLPQGYTSSGPAAAVANQSEPASADGMTYRWQVRARRSILAGIDSSLATNLVRSRPPEQAADLLFRAFPLKNQPEIEITPDWWPWLPVVPARIELVLVQP
jgi:hypothetical protein